MIVLTGALVAFAVADLVVWTVAAPGVARAAVAVLVSAAVAGGVAALAGQSAMNAIVVFGLGALACAAMWLWLCRRPRRSAASDGRHALPPLLFMLIVLVGAFTVSGSFSAAAGPLETWYGGLPFPFASHVPLDQFLIAIAAALFLLFVVAMVVFGAVVRARRVEHQPHDLVGGGAGQPPARSRSGWRGPRSGKPTKPLAATSAATTGESTLPGGRVID